MATFPDCGALVFGSKSECPLAVFGPVASKPPRYSTNWKGNKAQIPGNIFAQCSLAQRQLQPGDATYEHDQGCDYDEVIACNMYFAVLFRHFYIQYVYISISGIIMPHLITFLLHGSFQVYIILHVTLFFI